MKSLDFLLPGIAIGLEEKQDWSLRASVQRRVNGFGSLGSAVHTIPCFVSRLFVSIQRAAPIAAWRCGWPRLPRRSGKRGGASNPPDHEKGLELPLPHTQGRVSPGLARSM